MRSSLPITIFILAMLLSSGPAASVAQAPAAPSVTILQPFPGQVIPEGQEISVRFSVENFLFVDYKNNSEPFPGNPNAGHGHLWLDDATLRHETARKLLSDDPVALGALPRGEHTVTIELTQNHHAPFDPPARASVTFRVGGGVGGGLFSGGFGKGGGVEMQLLEFGGVALLAIGAAWLLMQKGAVSWLVKWASWERKSRKPMGGEGAGPSASA